MFIMIDGELLNLASISTVTQWDDLSGCTVQLVGGAVRTYKDVTPETFANAIISGDVVHYVKNE